MAPILNLKDVEKSYDSVSGENVVALKGLSLSVDAGDFITVVGPSGCGKTTLLKLMAGIEHPSGGELRYITNGNDLRVGFVFQTNTVFPWRTVERNLVYALEIRGESKPKRRSEAERLCRLLGLDPAKYLDKYPKELSGGEARRVAIGMALAHNATIMLLDEPTSQLDQFNKMRMQEVIQSIWLQKKFSVVHVTHDIDEAILLGNRVLLLDRGVMKHILEVALPRPRRAEDIGSLEFARLRTTVLRFYDNWAR